MEPLLITKADFLPYRNITVNIDDQKRLEPFILEAQRIDLCNMLGKRLYFDMVNNMDALQNGVTVNGVPLLPNATNGNVMTDDGSTIILTNPTYVPSIEQLAFIKLLNGNRYSHTWSDNLKTNKIYAGLKPVLVYLSFARFVRSDNIRSTQSGFVKKTTDFSTQVSDKEIQAVAARAETDANAFFSDTEDYMGDHSLFFSTYRNYGCAANESFRDKRKGTRLTAVTGRNYLRDTKRFI